MPGRDTERLVSLDAQTANATIGQYADCTGRPYVTVYVSGSNDTISSGVVTIEEADWDTNDVSPYSGTWSAITTVTASDVSDNKVKAIHLGTTAYHFVRCRITTGIGGGGTITAVIVAGAVS
jgi:hypothetical protein